MIGIRFCSITICSTKRNRVVFSFHIYKINNVRNINLGIEDCDKLTRSTKTRFRYMSLAAVLRKRQPHFLSDKSERNTIAAF